ncbi:unnamed protein product [Dracunculus medinensis]|uniref:Adenylate kinase isoenzyme 6 homolog n=1 Tax=Dracunculus medinensis TaxID=318479 RepID=A0A0N4ULA2_DRAME|nr:unnamed protein product [Dracunculus medinensis]
MATAETRKHPNILITGTPGSGKSTLSEILAKKLGFEHINVGKLIREYELYDEYDEEMDCHVLNEDKLLDHIEDRLDSDEGGYVVDYHGCDFFPERWFDFVIVLRCNNTILYDRLKARDYSEKKIRNNLECEIFNILLEEAVESYKAEIIHEMTNETIEQMNEICEKIEQMVSAWKN